MIEKLRHKRLPKVEKKARRKAWAVARAAKRYIPSDTGRKSR